VRYGFFDDQRREYVITRPDTPLPWINYLGCEEYFGLISNTAGGYSFFRDARQRRLTRYRYNNVPSDCGGRYVYLLDPASAAYWSPSWQPTQRELERYSCRHGLGYTIIGSTHLGIAAETCYFVPLGANLEVWRLTLTNRRRRAAELSVFAGVEFCLWDAWDDATNFQRNFSTAEVEVIDDGKLPATIYHKTEYRERRNHFAYFACSVPISGFDTGREQFLGPYRGWDRPWAVERGRCADSVAHGWAPVGFFQVELRLGAGESRQVVFLLGYHENPKESKFDPPDSQIIDKRGVTSVIARYTDAEVVEAALRGLSEHWNELVGCLQVETPDVHTNRMVNVWNPYQCMATFNLSRSASYFESGIARGLGFRDSNQDLLGFVHMAPPRARQRLLDLAATQLPSGGAYHQYQPLTRRGNDAIGSNFNDDPLWLPLAVGAYLKESGEYGVLDEPVPYDNAPGSEAPLYEHLERSIRYTLERLGPHGLPLIGRADWNDCLNLNCFSDTPGQSFQTAAGKDGKVAESVFIAGLFVLAAGEMAEIAERRGLVGEARRYRQEAAAMDRTVRLHGWDGEWFLRAYDDAGEKVGSHVCPEGKIFVEPQGLCVMAGIGLSNGLGRKALDAVGKWLATPHGIVLQQPAYSRYYLHLGEISSYPPGYKENGGIFCHNNPWVMIAEVRTGNGDGAHDYYLRINPSAREQISEVHRCEPYVYAQMIAGPDAPTHGEAKNSWLTGTAAWNYVAVTQWILGVRPGHGGLVVAPVFPAGWPGFRMRRRFRGVTYHIEVQRRGSGNSISLTVDGRPAAGNVIPPPPEGVEEVRVRATVG
jgi:cellobiose phosphorylase